MKPKIKMRIVHHYCNLELCNCIFVMAAGEFPSGMRTFTKITAIVGIEQKSEVDSQEYWAV